MSIFYVPGVFLWFYLLNTHNNSETGNWGIEKLTTYAKAPRWYVDEADMWIQAVWLQSQCFYHYAILPTISELNKQRSLLSMSSPPSEGTDM